MTNGERSFEATKWFPTAKSTGYCGFSVKTCRTVHPSGPSPR